MIPQRWLLIILVVYSILGIVHSLVKRLLAVILLLLLVAAGQTVGTDTTELQWRVGEVVTAALDIPAPKDTIPARTVLELSMTGADGRVQSATSAAGRELDVPVSLTSVNIAAPGTPKPQTEQKTDARLGNQLILPAYDVERDPDGAAVSL